MKDLKKSTFQNFSLLGSMPKRKTAIKGVKAIESFRPMRSCSKKPSFKPKTLAVELMESNAK